MSLLTTFGILFETDAERARREIDGVDQSLEHTEQTANDTTGAFDDLNDEIDNSTDSFFDLSDGLSKAAAGLVVVTGLFAGITAQALGTDSIGKFSETLGFSVEEVGAWGEAAIRSGGSAEAFRGSLASLSGQLTDISLTGGGAAAETLARLGINAVGAGGKIKSAFEILPELADSFANLSKSQSVAFGQKLGLDQGTILLLQQGRVGVEELVKRQKSLGVATKEDAAAAAEFNDVLADSRQEFQKIFTTAGTTILPLVKAVRKGFEAMSSWIKENETLVTGFFVGVAGAITYTFLPAIVAAASAAIAMALPFVAMAAVVTAVGAAFAILFEDVVAYVNGQQSYIGDLAKKYEWFGDIVDAVIAGVKASFESLQGVFDWLVTLFTSPNEAIKQLGDNIQSMIDDALNLIPSIGDAIDNSLSDLQGLLGFGDDEISANLNKAIMISGAIDNNPLNGQTSASIVNSQQSSSRVNNVNIGATSINTQATDAAGVASAVSGSLNNQVSMAIAQLDDAEAY